MLDGQIRPSGVIRPDVIKAFSDIPRESFVPETEQNVSYLDEEIIVSAGRFLLEPSVCARMIEALDPGQTDQVLDVGGATGYSSAILGAVSHSVCLYETSDECRQHADMTFKTLEIDNVTFSSEMPNRNSFDLAFMNGAVADTPEDILHCLRPGGRMIAVFKPIGHKMGQATIYRHLGEGQFSSHPLFDVACPYLPNYGPEETFSYLRDR